MAGQRRAPRSVRLTPFAKQCLEDLVAKLATTKPVVEAGEPDVVGALVYAAGRSPLEAVKAEIGVYRDVELEVAAVAAVCAFLRHYGAASARKP